MAPMADQVRLRAPSDEEVRAFLARQSARPFSYPHVGNTAGDPPAGYRTAAASAPLGKGRARYERAVAEVRAWRMFDLPWVRRYPAAAPSEPGTTVALVATWAGLWSMDALRVVYEIDEERRVGFATGTLPGHLLAGEERFLVTLADDESVVFAIESFSRPDHPLAWAGLPIVHYLQARFRRQALARIGAL